VLLRFLRSSNLSGPAFGENQGRDQLQPRLALLIAQYFSARRCVSSKALIHVWSRIGLFGEAPLGRPPILAPVGK
jgi:hypothetical protein